MAIARRALLHIIIWAHFIAHQGGRGLAMRSYSLSLILCSILLSSDLFGQVTLSHQVVGTAGSSAQLGSNRRWSYTLGESVIGTANYDDITLTQGFHQPIPKGLLQFELTFFAASCPSSTDGGAQVIGVNGCTPPYTITWSNGQVGPAVDRLSPGLYSVTVSTVDCELTETFAIESGPQEDCILRFFNAFSPNGDGVNNTWRIENIQLPEFGQNKVEIYNRWGQEVWSASNYNNTDVVWDGLTNDGVILPSATYFYMVDVAGVMYKGFVELTK